MSDIGTITDGIITKFDAIADVDSTSKDGYLPGVATDRIGLIVPPLGLQSTYGMHNFSNGATYQAHRIPVEFWVKLKSANDADAMQRARDIGGAAVAALLADTTIGGTVDTVGFFDGQDSFDFDIIASVANAPVQIGNSAYIVVTVIVPVTKFS